MMAVRPPAVAGQFYPGEAAELDRQVQAMLAQATAEGGGSAPVPKAVIAPHAGYIYSGPIAASAYARLAPGRGVITRVVLIGPAHRVALRGLAVSTAEAFATPLGEVAVDKEAVRRLLELPQVTALDEAHALEHSLEVQLPFLQKTLTGFTIVPLVVGQASADEVAQVLDLLWGGPETAIVVSSDLSHYHDYETAQRMDGATSRAIERLRPDAISADQACGRVPVNGLLTLARRRGLTCTTVDLRNSGDTAGPRDRVVGYGAYVFCGDRASYEDRPGDPLRDAHGDTLLGVAGASIDHGLAEGAPLAVEKPAFAPRLREQGASFVTLKIAGTLRGCVGSPRAWRPLVEDVSENAYRAAFKDPRFRPLSQDERARLEISISVLTAPVEMACESETALLRQIRPGVDGLILEDGRHRGLFLPAVWESLPDPRQFLHQLKRKAGLAPDHWSETTRAFRFAALSITPSDPGQID